MEEPEYTRLHITPFNAGLLKTILPPSILPNARNISYHSILTFPEKGYGYVELPTMDAEKIKKKLNGTTLKGTKVRIEKARPEKEIVIEEADEEPARPRKERKPQRKRDELPGVDIGERQVKRGWTTPAKDAKKDQPVIKSKYTTGPECLFKTNLPPNVASRGKIAEKIAEPKPDKKKRKPGKEAVVHEFAKTTKYATFLRGSGVSNTTRIVVEFVEGKGWVDEEGNVVEEARKSRKIIQTPVEKRSEAKDEDTEPDRLEVDVVESASEKEGNSSESSSSSKDSESESDSDVEVAEEIEQQVRAEQDAQLQSTAQGSSSESSSSSSDSEDDQMEENIISSGDSPEDESHHIRSSPSPFTIQDSAAQESSSSDNSSDESIAEAQAPNQTSSSSSDSSDDSDSSDESDADSEVEEPQSAVTIKSQGSSGLSLSIQIPESLTSTPIASSVHPLEALYKRPKSSAMDPPKAVESSFSFFGADGDEDIEEEAHPQVPLTPFTQKDFEYRGLRSAAPTPDTAHPNKRFIWPSEKDDEEEDDDDEAAPSTPIRKGTKAEVEDKETAPETDFQKWFYENRGDVRRAWTGRKKAAAKEKRQRENRKRDHRAI